MKSIAILGLSAALFAAGPMAVTTQANAQQMDEKKMSMKGMEKPASEKSMTWARDKLKGWPQKNQETAAKMIDEYGEPDGQTDMLLIWNESGPFKQTILSKEQIDHRFPMPHKDYLEQVIDYKVPPDKFDELARYDGSVIAERTKGTLSARCDKEAANFLALNLAHDIVTDRKSVEQAREYYARAIKDMMAGKMDPYLEKLQFNPPSGRTADADSPAPAMRSASSESPTGK